MASIPRPWRADEIRSGGKIVRSRRTARTTTPYDRPELPPNSSPQNPDWLSRIIYSPTRMIASGAGKIISSVFTNESSSSSLSSSSGSGSDDEIYDENDDNHISSKGTDIMKKNGTAQTIQRIRSEPRPIVEKGQTKHLIEQLLIEVTFSREECDRLTSIIKSRVVDGLVIGDTKDQSLTEQPKRTIGGDVDMPDLSSAAVMEAKKWLEGKKSGSSPKPELEHRCYTVNSAMLLPVTEARSPVDMAKSYMQTRPPWASPSVTPTEYRSTSPTGIQLFEKETPYATGYTSLTSTKMQRDSPASATWNILDEIRKVRSKATEEMLKTPPSSKIDWSSFALENKSVTNPFAADEVEASKRNKEHSSTKPAHASVNLATGVSTLFGFPASQMTHDRLQNEAELPNRATFVFYQNQDLENIQTIVETAGRLSCEQRVKSLEDTKTVVQTGADAANIDGVKDTNGTSQLFNSSMGGTPQGLKVELALNAVPDSGNNQNCLTSKEMVRKDGSFAINGFRSSGFSLSTGQDREENSGPSDEKQNPAGSGHEEVPPNVPTGEECQLLSEASVDVPVTYENESFPTGSPNSSSMQNKGLSYNLTMPNSRRHVKASGAAEKQPEKKPSRYSRRGRGRGK